MLTPNIASHEFQKETHIKLHERCLRIAHSDKTSSFQKLLETGRSVPINIRNLQILLATEIFKISTDLAPTIFGEIFSK